MPFRSAVAIAAGLLALAFAITLHACSASGRYRYLPDGTVFDTGTGTACDYGIRGEYRCRTFAGKLQAYDNDGKPVQDSRWWEDESAFSKPRHDQSDGKP